MSVPAGSDLWSWLWPRAQAVHPAAAPEARAARRAGGLAEELESLPTVMITLEKM